MQKATQGSESCPRQSGDAGVLLDYCSRKLDAERTLQFERHLCQCAACQEWVSGQSAVWSALDLFEAEPVSPEFDRNLYRRIQENERISAWDRFRSAVVRYVISRPSWKPAIPIAVASCLVAAVVLLRMDRGTQEGRVAVDEQVVEQVERVLEDMDMLRQFDAVALPAGDPTGSNKGSNLKKEIL